MIDDDRRQVPDLDESAVPRGPPDHERAIVAIPGGGGRRRRRAGGFAAAVIDRRRRRVGGEDPSQEIAVGIVRYRWRRDRRVRRRLRGGAPPPPRRPGVRGRSPESSGWTTGGPGGGRGRGGCGGAGGCAAGGHRQISQSVQPYQGLKRDGSGSGSGRGGGGRCNVSASSAGARARKTPPPRTIPRTTTHRQDRQIPQRPRGPVDRDSHVPQERHPAPARGQYSRAHD